MAIHCHCDRRERPVSFGRPFRTGSCMPHRNGCGTADPCFVTNGRKKAAPASFTRSVRRYSAPTALTSMPNCSPWGERIWRNLDLRGIRLELNSLGQAEERAAYREKLVEYLHGHREALDEDTLQRLSRNPLRVLDSKQEKVQALLENAPLLPDFLGTDSRRHFDALRSMLDRLGIEYETEPAAGARTGLLLPWRIRVGYIRSRRPGHHLRRRAL